MGLFTRHPKVDPAEVTALRNDLDELRQLLAVSDQKRHQVEVQLTEIVGQAETLSTQSDSLRTINASLAALAERVSSTATEARRATEQNAAVQQRITNIATELTNQFGELSNELDALQTAQTTHPELPAPVLAETQAVTPEVLEQLRQSQIRLANEQARYEIAFKQDLAALAESLKRNR